LVYDVNNYHTFENLARWRREFLEKAAPPDPERFPFVIIGNKIDLNQRKVSSRQVQEFALQCTADAERYPVPCFEASAKNGTNVEAAFSEIACVVRVPQLELDVEESDTRMDGYNRGFDQLLIRHGAADYGNGIYTDDWTFRLAHGAERPRRRARTWRGGCC
jgi:GTPase SAR1 family protein